MAYPANVIPVMIASPSDLQDERNIIRGAIYDINNIYAKENSAVLMPVGWDTHSPSEIVGRRGQELINERLLRDCDLLVAVFGHKIGTPTGDYPSGSVEEIERHVAAGKPAMVYFTKQLAPIDADQSQLTGVQKLRAWCESRGIYKFYADLEDLRHTVDRDIRILLIENPYLRGLRGAAETWGGVGTPTITTAPPGSSLSTEAKTLLIESSKSRSGQFFQSATLAGWGVQIDSKPLNDDDSRSVALWKEAIQQLEDHGLAVPLGSRRQVFELTAEGFRVADAISTYIKSPPN
jgi:hypothetical protein